MANAITTVDVLNGTSHCATNSTGPMAFGP